MKDKLDKDIEKIKINRMSNFDRIIYETIKYCNTYNFNDNTLKICINSDKKILFVIDNNVLFCGSQLFLFLYNSEIFNKNLILSKFLNKINEYYNLSLTSVTMLDILNQDKYEKLYII
jgi:hypothetical protein